MRSFSRGFTLIELMITCVVIAILAAIAVPQYSRYIARQKVNSGQMDLVSLAMNMDVYLQNNTTYPATAADTAAVKVLLPAWAPAQGADFNYKISAVSNSVFPPTYTVEAVGTSTAVSGCTISLTSANGRTRSGCAGGATTW
ncbi:type IV pilin protein [Roseateles sp. BYS96W]|uniref:Type IV pilin protein n=1 Tax=Pelomonas nitida TaxID=3299027 RepID=A0ABW7G2N1_9BURK